MRVRSRARFKGLRSRWQYLRTQRAFQRHPIRTLLRLARWRISCWLKREAIIRFEPGISMRLAPSWHGVAKLFYAFREDYEAELAWARRWLKPGMVCVDGGAAMGIWTLTVAKLVGSSGRVIAFEPSAELFSILRENVRLNGVENVVLVRKALADRSGTGSLYHSRHTPGSYSLEKEAGVESETVELVLLTEALADLGIREVDLVKLDLEGADGTVLREAEALLVGERAPVVIYEQEWVPGASPGANPLEAWTVLERLGYAQYQLDQRRLHPRRLESPAQGGNVLALPKGGEP